MQRVVISLTVLLIVLALTWHVASACVGWVMWSARFHRDSKYISFAIADGYETRKECEEARIARQPTDPDVLKCLPAGADPRPRGN